MKYPGTTNNLIDGKDPFEWSNESFLKAKNIIKKYPIGREQSAVIPLLDLAQRQNKGWLNKKALEKVAETLSMSFIRVLEVATFYSMFNLEPIGENFIQICRTTPCWLRGSDNLTKIAKNILGCKLGETSKDNRFEGGQDSDILSGNAGTDTLIGGTGADTLSGGSGDDFIYGNEESSTSTDSSRDVVDYTNASNDIIVNLSSTISNIKLSKETSTTLGTQTAVGEGTDRLYDIQDVIGSSRNDTLIGNDEVNSLLGGNGNDLLIGGAGADILQGQGDNDTILGGLDGDIIYGGTFDGTLATNNGNDTVDYSYIGDTRAINADLSLGTNQIKQIGTPTNTDTLTHIENKQKQILMGPRLGPIIAGVGTVGGKGSYFMCVLSAIS